MITWIAIHKKNRGNPYFLSANQIFLAILEFEFMLPKLYIFVSPFNISHVSALLKAQNFRQFDGRDWHFHLFVLNLKIKVYSRQAPIRYGFNPVINHHLRVLGISHSYIMQQVFFVVTMRRRKRYHSHVLIPRSVQIWELYINNRN